MSKTICRRVLSCVIDEIAPGSASSVFGAATKQRASFAKTLTDKVVDASAVVALLLDEPAFDACCLSWPQAQSSPVFWRRRCATFVSGARRNERNPEARGDPGIRRGRLQPTCRSGRGPHPGATPDAAQRRDRPYHLRASRARRQTHGRRRNRRVSQRG